MVQTFDGVLRWPAEMAEQTTEQNTYGVDAAILAQERQGWMGQWSLSVACWQPEPFGSRNHVPPGYRRAAGAADLADVWDLRVFEALLVWLPATALPCGHTARGGLYHLLRGQMNVHYVLVIKARQHGGGEPVRPLVAVPWEDILIPLDLAHAEARLLWWKEQREGEARWRKAKLMRRMAKRAQQRAKLARLETARRKELRERERLEKERDVGSPGWGAALGIAVVEPNQEYLDRIKGADAFVPVAKAAREWRRAARTILRATVEAGNLDRCLVRLPTGDHAIPLEAEVGLGALHVTRFHTGVTITRVEPLSVCIAFRDVLVLKLA